MDLMLATTSPNSTGMTRTCNMGLGMSGQKFFRLELHELLTMWDESYVAFFLTEESSLCNFYYIFVALLIKKICILVPHTVKVVSVH